MGAPSPEAADRYSVLRFPTGQDPLSRVSTDSHRSHIYHSSDSPTTSPRLRSSRKLPCQSLLFGYHPSLSGTLSSTVHPDEHSHRVSSSELVEGDCSLPFTDSTDPSPISDDAPSESSSQLSTMSTTSPTATLPTRPPAARESSSNTISTIRPSSIIMRSDISTSQPAGQPEGDILTPQPRQRHSLVRSRDSIDFGSKNHRAPQVSTPVSKSAYSSCVVSPSDSSRPLAFSPHHRTHSASAPPEMIPDMKLLADRGCACSIVGRTCHPSLCRGGDGILPPLPYGRTSIQNTPEIHQRPVGSWSDYSMLGHRDLSTSSVDAAGRYPYQNRYFSRSVVPKETNVLNSAVDPVSGSKRINQYDIVGELGRGVHGKVKLGQDVHTGQKVAIKIVERAPKQKRLGRVTSHSDKIRKEIAILKKARHPNIVGLIEVIDDPAIRKVYIVLEYVEMGEVRWRVPSRSEIALVEYRRFLRESGQVPVTLDDPAAIREDQAILDEAAFACQQRATRHSRTNSRSQGWNLESGGYESDERSVQNPSRRPSRADVSGASFDVNLYDLDDLEDGNMTTAEMAPGLLRRPLEGKGTPTPTPRSFSKLRDSKYVPDHFKYAPIMTLERARRVFRDTVLGVGYLHYQGIIHRDIKPANLLETKEGVFKISDFGVSYLGRNGRGQGDEEVEDIDDAVELAKTVGTPAFYAPELCNTDENAAPVNLSEQLDVWALGVMLFCFVYGRVPFHDANTFVLMRMISKDSVVFPRYRLKAVIDSDATGPPDVHHRHLHEQAYEQVDDELRDLMQKLLVKDPSDRITISQIKQHPWFVAGIENPEEWSRVTDPSHLCEGKRIEVSTKDVVDAVVPLSIVERVASVARRITDALGVGRDSSRRRRDKGSSGTLSHPSLRSNASQDLTQSCQQYHGYHNHYHHKSLPSEDALPIPVPIPESDSHRTLGISRSRHILQSRSGDLSDARGSDRSLSGLKGFIHDARSKILRSVRSREGQQIHPASTGGSGRVVEPDQSSSVNSASTSVSSSVPDSNIYQPYISSALSSTVVSPATSNLPSRAPSMSYGNEKIDDEAYGSFTRSTWRVSRSHTSNAGIDSSRLRNAFEDSFPDCQPGTVPTAAACNDSVPPMADQAARAPTGGMISSSSSDDCMTSDVSRSTSYPSIPSVMSQGDMKRPGGPVFGDHHKHHHHQHHRAGQIHYDGSRPTSRSSSGVTPPHRRVTTDGVSLRTPIREEDDPFSESHDDDDDNDDDDDDDIAHEYIAETGSKPQRRIGRLEDPVRSTGTGIPITTTANNDSSDDDSDGGDDEDDDDGFLYMPRRSKSQKCAPGSGSAGFIGGARLPSTGLMRAASEAVQSSMNLRRAATVAAPTSRPGTRGRLTSSGVAVNPNAFDHDR